MDSYFHHAREDGDFERNKIWEHVKLACEGIPITPSEAVTRFLSVDDEVDIVNDDLTVEALGLALSLWVDEGRPFYSGKECLV